MERMNSFIIENIESIGRKEIVMTIRIGQIVKSFNIILSNSHSVSLPEKLDLILMHKDFNYHREFFKIISDFRSGIEFGFPITLFEKSKMKKQELQLA